MFILVTVAEATILWLVPYSRNSALGLLQ